MSTRKRATVRPKTPRTPNRFRERELARAVRAAKAGGASRVIVDPGTGRISVILGEQAEPEPSDTPERIISKL